MARYAVLRHEMPADSDRMNHFDLLLQQDDSLATWEIQHWPPVFPQRAKRLPDHRNHYLEFEGPLSGNRGSVHRVCQGTMELLKQNDRTWIVEMSGRNFDGVIQLQSESNQMDQCWILSLESATVSSGVPVDEDVS